MKYPQPNDRYDCSVLCSNFMEIERNFKLQSDEIDRVRKDSVHNKGAILNKAEGENISVNDSAEAIPFSLKLFGKAKQQTTSGKNKFDFENTKWSINSSATVSKNNGILTIQTNGERVSGVYCYTLTEDLIGKTLTFSADITISNGSKILFGMGSALADSSIIANQKTKKSFTLTPTNNSGFVIYSGEDLVKTITVENIQLEVGELTEYEEYSGGMASPNPEFPQEIEVSGESYNLLENTAESQIINGGTVTVNEDKSITVNGTFAAETTLILNRVDLKANTGYILSGCPSGGSITTYRLLFQESSLGYAQDTGNGVSVTPKEDIESARITLQIFSGTINNLTFYPMIRKASVKNDRYMPYGKGSVEVKSVGKNLCGNLTNEELDVSTGQIKRVSSVFICSGYFPIKENTPYRISVNGSLIEGRMFYYDKDKNFISSVNSNTHTSPIGARYARMHNGNYNGDLTLKIQIEEGIVTPFEPYKETKPTIPTDGLAGIPVSSGGNYTDSNGQQWIANEIVKYADGSGERIQRVGKTEFTSETTWEKVRSKQFYTMLDSKKYLNDSFGLCSVMLSKNNDATNNIFINTSGAIRLNYETEEVEIIKEIMADSYYYGILAEPIRTPLTAEEISEIEKLSMFNPVTNISNDADVNMVVEYIADTNIYIDNLKAAHDADIRKLTAAIEALGGTVE